VSRWLSYSETSKLLTCQRAHAFAYTGVLTDGTALKPKVSAETLREGSSWGRGLAAWHETGDVPKARRELLRSLFADAKVMRREGVFIGSVFKERARRLLAILDHHVSTAERFENFHSPERRLLVPVPKVKGVKLLAYLDGIAVKDGSAWIVENKFRADLQTLAQVELGRQYRLYAWACRESFGIEVVGIIVDERVNGLPGPVVLNKPNEKTGLAAPRKGQAGCSPEDYLAACEAAEMEPDADTLAKLHGKRWHVQHHVMFRPGELDETELELRSIAAQVRRMDVGETYPVANPMPGFCQRCEFREICPDPEGLRDLIDFTFKRVPPKASRPTD
jgi:hypothetical protein